jgi:DNA polymerase V
MDLFPNAAPMPVLIAAFRPVPAPSASMHAGFPSPADDHEDRQLDLSLRFVPRPTSTFIVQATGESMMGAGILRGDYLLVDRSRDPRDGDVVLAIVDGEFTVKRFRHDRLIIRLDAEHPGFPSIPWRDGCEVWGVVTSVHRDLASVK